MARWWKRRKKEPKEPDLSRRSFVRGMGAAVVAAPAAVMAAKELAESGIVEAKRGHAIGKTDLTTREWLEREHPLLLVENVNVKDPKRYSRARFDGDQVIVEYSAEPDFSVISEWHPVEDVDLDAPLVTVQGWERVRELLPTHVDMKPKTANEDVRKRLGEFEPFYGMTRGPVAQPVGGPHEPIPGTLAWHARRGGGGLTVTRYRGRYPFRDLMADLTTS